MIKRKLKLTKLILMALCCTAIVPNMAGCGDKIKVEMSEEEAEAADTEIAPEADSSEEKNDDTADEENKTDEAEENSEDKTDDSEEAEKVAIDVDTVANSSSDNFKMVVEKKGYDEVLAYVNGLGGEVKEMDGNDSKIIKCRFKNFKDYNHLWFELTYFFDLEGNMKMYTETLSDVSGKKIYSENMEPLFNTLLEHYKEIYGEPEGGKVKIWYPEGQDGSTKVLLQYHDSAVTGTVTYK